MSETDQLAWQRLARTLLGSIRAAGYAITALSDPANGLGLQALHSQSEDNRRDHIARAEQMLRKGEPLLAYNTVSRALLLWPDDLRLRQLMGIALARSGAVRRAYKWLKAMRDGGARDGETLGPLARTQKDLAQRADSPQSRERYLGAAFEIYEYGYRQALLRSNTEDAYYTGINAAAMALLRNDRSAAATIALDVRRLCEEALARSGNAHATYWIQATMAEADLILGDLERARAEYAAAAADAGRRYGDVSSTRRQAGGLARRGAPGTARPRVHRPHAGPAGPRRIPLPAGSGRGGGGAGAPGNCPHRSRGRLRLRRLRRRYPRAGGGTRRRRRGSYRAALSAR